MAAAGSEKKGKGGSGELKDALKPFYARASEAEDRLSRLEAALASKRDAGNEELLSKISQLESQLGAANAELASEREKVHKFVLENAKLQYRAIHLVGAVKESDAKLASLTGEMDASTLNVAYPIWVLVLLLSCFWKSIAATTRAALSV